MSPMPKTGERREVACLVVFSRDERPGTEDTKGGVEGDALGFCLYVALLVHALVERELRQAMAAAGIASLPLYHEDRSCSASTAARVFELFEPLCQTAIFHVRDLLTVTPPTLDPLQRQILTLLNLPHRAYQSAGPAAGKSR